jgi:hypothetical protein
LTIARSLGAKASLDRALSGRLSPGGTARRLVAERLDLGGRTFRDRGSLHSDFWFGSAADLAERDAVVVFPVGGWWKEKPYLERNGGAAPNRIRRARWTSPSEAAPANTVDQVSTAFVIKIAVSTGVKISTLAPGARMVTIKAYRASASNRSASPKHVWSIEELQNARAAVAPTEPTATSGIQPRAAGSFSAWS